jgi:hypothetical protein
LYLQKVSYCWGADLQTGVMSSVKPAGACFQRQGM